ncbi:hypothetical protein C474_02091 [Halogeometricum pallidum JCM 14848]|uniref:Uncharacterized protein n=1 Tax=Halogeometricum pallidum JCM 14848 TaxID=1227487 RepID=M0DI37_HALPD|nr:hypothetical protein [Halogeometricum pallidum]ELZ34458.1 hypothetical protein C474_02091 [Halogeometricum pallidum JCM 14848]
MSGTSDDGYRRGRQVEGEGRRRVGSVYRRLLLIIWTIGTVIALAVFGANVSGALAVVVVMHVFFSGIIWADIRALRKQGVEWGLSRHLWFASALVFPFVTLLYCWYVNRVVRRENERRGFEEEEPSADDDPTDSE